MADAESVIMTDVCLFYPPQRMPKLLREAPKSKYGKYGFDGRTRKGKIAARYISKVLAHTFERWLRGEDEPCRSCIDGRAWKVKLLRHMERRRRSKAEAG